MTGAGSVGHSGGTPGHLAVPPDLLTARRRRGSVGFIVFLSLATVLGAGVMSLVLLASGAPNALVVGTVLAAIPVGPLIACFLWLDRYEPEPGLLIAFALGWGAVVATAISLFLQVAGQALLGTPALLAGTVTAPVTEELAKGVFVLLLLFVRRHELDGILDGIVYAGMVGIGFAFVENILYLASAYMGGQGIGPGGIGAVTGTFVVRGIFSPFAHPLFTALTGIGVGYAVTTRSAFWRVTAPLLGFLAAVLAHGLWNGSAFFEGGRFFILTYVFAMVPAFLLAVGIAVWVRRREGRLLTRALNDCADRGFLSHAEVPWLVRLPARRTARQFAAGNGGPDALKAMREYQQQAIELGFLHDRFLRGTAPRDFVGRGQVMVDHLAALRPYVLFPRVPDRTFRSQGPSWEGGQ